MAVRDAGISTAEAYEEAWSIIMPLMATLDRDSGSTNICIPTATESALLHRAVYLFKVVLHHYPSNASALWGLGKAYQALRLPQQALDCFEQTCELNDAAVHLHALKEASVCALDLGQMDAATTYCRQAIAVCHDPSEIAGVHCNFAMTLALQNQLTAAEEEVNMAFRMHPDPCVLATKQFINDLQSGRADLSTHGIPCLRVI